MLIHSIPYNTYIIIDGLYRIFVVLFLFFLAKKWTFLKLNRIFKFNIGLYLFVGIILAITLFKTIPLIGIKYSLVDLSANLFLCLCVGLFEEVLFRWIVFGFVVVSLPNMNLFKQILLSSFVFAIFHIVNLLSGRITIYSTINQIELAFVIGLFFQCMFIKFRNIILVVILHGLFNFWGMYNTSLLGVESKVVEEQSEFWTSFIPTQFTFLILLAIMLPLTYLFSKAHTNKLILVE